MLNRSVVAVAALALARQASAQESAVPAPAGLGMAPLQMPKTVVYGSAEFDGGVAYPFPAEVDGTRVFAGKKVTIFDFATMPAAQTDTYRTALSQIPGLLVSELSGNSILSIGYRGIGDPHETQNLLVLRDGIPFVVDLYGYPTVYYAPPFEITERFEFVRGGASLMYGPQPSGALNFVTRQPRKDREFGIRNQTTAGSYGRINSHTMVDGTVGKLGYLVSFDHRQGDGYRRENSDFELNGGTVRLTYDFAEHTRMTFDLDAVHSDSGDAGGLTRHTGAGLAVFDVDPRQTQTRFDRVRVTRYLPALTLEHAFSENTLLTARAWGGYYERFSKRQRTSGGSSFGAVSNLIDSNTINIHRYYTFGAEGRLRHDWSWGGESHTLAGGVMTYVADSPFEVDRGATANADTGTARQRSHRETAAGSVFAENVFRYRRLSITPGFRIENIHQSIHESLNLDKTATNAPALLSDSYVDHVPLGALGATFALDASNEVYANVSQGYKAKAYSDAVPLNNGTVVSDSLDPANAWTYEAGVRGRPAPWAHYDVSVFLIDYDNRFGTVSRNGVNEIRNVGRSINRGIDISGEVDLIGLADRLARTKHGETWGSFSLYANASLLDAEFVSGPLDGRTPQYAPDYMVRAGAIYRLAHRCKVAFLGTYVGDHFANDNNTADFRVPSYKVWDLTAEVEVWKDHARIVAGLNNVFDERYFSRVRSTGIDPAYGRNFYAGLSLAF
jgi:Fe(3+) dicitrate transport protein